MHAHLAHGDWLDWLDEEVPFTQRSAANYVRLSAWADQHPSDYLRLKSCRRPDAG